MSSTSDLTAKCIQCGFCLESCPTFTETGLETKSPRGRISLVRAAEEGKLRWSDLKEPLDSCLGCRACETACPSGVQYGEILERARSRLAPDPKAVRMLGLLTRPGLLRLALLGAAISPELAQRASGGFKVPTPQPRDSWPPLENIPNPTRTIRLLDGCVMPVMFARAREATIRLLRRCGTSVEVVRGCCGALHAHQGQLAEGTYMRDSLPSDLVADVAGCGSWLRDERPDTRDITEVLLELGLADLLQRCGPLKLRVAYHDACHLAHGQHVRNPPRELLAAIPGVELVSLAESDTCCGSAGIYNVLQPEMARRLLARKWQNIVAADIDVVVTGNAGCQSWISTALTAGVSLASLRPPSPAPDTPAIRSGSAAEERGWGRGATTCTAGVSPAPLPGSVESGECRRDASGTGPDRRQVASGTSGCTPVVLHTVELLEAAFSGMPE